ncbi:MAG: cyanophycinase [Actinobacteria bacterium]|nr:cyanophycinase [Actinomycetota bacterium]
MTQDTGDTEDTGREPWSRVGLGTAGAVMVIGGAEDKVRDKTILARFAHLAGGAEAKVVVISTASSLGEAATDTYRDLFGGLGITDVDGVRPEERQEADDPGVVKLMGEATGVFLTGGNQSRLTQIVGGTRLGDALANAHDRGAVLAGTSAGASAMASHMVAYGQPGNTPKNRMVQLSAGLGILPGIVIDQHFEQRGRHGRLLALVAQSPSLVGMGLDEDTCAIVYPDQTLQVLGKGAVTIVDGRHVRTDAYRGKGWKPLMVSGAILHSLPSGYWFDLRSRSLLAGEDALGREREASE